MNSRPQQLTDQLAYLKLRFMEQNYQALAATAATKGWSHEEYFEKLIHGETDFRWDNAIQRRIRMARFPVIKTLDHFEWNWPKKINQMQVKHLFRLGFITEKANVIMLGGVGLGNYAKFLVM